jgi:cytochrome c553
VSSVETGWPENGFRLHTAYPAYVPNYTTAMYAKGYDMPDATLANGATGLNVDKGMAGWCAGCHNTYLGPVETFTKTNALGISTDYQSVASTYNAGDGMGLALRHKHPINVELETYNGPDKASMIVTDQVLPLAHGIDEQGAPTNEAADWIECLTCHRAHGTSSDMIGYASNAGADTVLDSDGIARNNFPAQNPVPSALLRYDNRGVCERCHNK